MTAEIKIFTELKKKNAERARSAFKAIGYESLGSVGRAQGDTPYSSAYERRTMVKNAKFLEQAELEYEREHPLALRREFDLFEEMYQHALELSRIYVLRARGNSAC